MPDRTEKIWWLLKSAEDENAQSARDWVDGYLGHEGISHTTDIEECIVNGYVTIGDNGIVGLSAVGRHRLAELSKS
jgi:type IV secretory pathway VirB4 component